MPDGRYSRQAFLEKTKDRDLNQGLFELESERMLDINLNGEVWIKMMKRMTAVLAGGLFNVRLEGSGMVAVTSHYDPMTLLVTPPQPVVTDPNATVLWSGNIEPEIKTDLQFKTFLGRGSGESLQLKFQGNGFVVVQPYEEVTFQHGAS